MAPDRGLSAGSPSLAGDNSSIDGVALASRPPLANMITHWVHDLARQRGFYQHLGWPIVLDSDDFIVFELRAALLAMCPLDRLAPYAHT